MSGVRTPLLIVAGGCVAMVAAAAATVSFGAFFSDSRIEPTNVVEPALVPAKKVKTVSLPKAEPQPAVNKVAAANTPVAAPQRAADVAKPTPVKTATVTMSRVAPAPVDPTAKLESAFAAQGMPGRTPAADATAQELGEPGATFAALANAKDESAAAVAFPDKIDVVPSPPQRKRASEADRDEETQSAVSGQPLIMRTGVNMRAQGKSGAKVIGTIPSGAKVTVDKRCQHWCRVSYAGKTGYVYRSFIMGGGKKSVSREQLGDEDQQEANQRQPAAAAKVESPAGLFGNGGVFAGAAKGSTSANATEPTAPRKRFDDNGAR